MRFARRSERAGPMTLSQILIAVSAVGIVVLIVVVARLTSQLAQLSRRVGDLQRAPQPTPPLPSMPTSAVEPVAASEDQAVQSSPERPTVQRGAERDEDVSVITRLDVDPGDDPTTARIASVTLGGPLIKVAAFSHGVRRALREEHRMRIAYVMRKEMRRQRKIRRRRRSEPTPSQGWRP